MARALCSSSALHKSFWKGLAGIFAQGTQFDAQRGCTEAIGAAHSADRLARGGPVGMVGG